MKNKPIIQLFGTVFLLLHQASGQCPSKCFCFDSYITCTGLTSIPLQFPEETRYLAFSEIDVDVIPAGVFNTLPLLETLEIYDGKIGTILSDAFSSFTALESISLSELSIGVIESYAFYNITDTGTVSFDYSTIETIQPYAFFDIFALDLIRFTSNKVKFIDSFAFSTIDDLLEFKFESNYVRTMKPFAFSQFSNFYEVSMYLNMFGEIGCGSIEALLDQTDEQSFYSNIFNCTCNIIWASNNPTLKNYLFSNSCQLPRTEERVKWEELSTETLQCDEGNYDCPSEEYYEMLIPNVRVASSSSSPKSTTTTTRTSMKSTMRTTSPVNPINSKYSLVKSSTIPMSTPKTITKEKTGSGQIQQSSTLFMVFSSTEQKTLSTAKARITTTKSLARTDELTKSTGKSSATTTKNLNIGTTKSNPKIVITEKNQYSVNITKQKITHGEPVTAVLKESDVNGANTSSCYWFFITTLLAFIKL